MRSSIKLISLTITIAIFLLLNSLWFIFVTPEGHANIKPSGGGGISPFFSIILLIVSCIPFAYVRIYILINARKIMAKKKEGIKFSQEHPIMNVIQWVGLISTGIFSIFIIV